MEELGNKPKLGQIESQAWGPLFPIGGWWIELIKYINESHPIYSSQIV